MLASAADYQQARVPCSVIRPGSASAGIQLAPRQDQATIDMDREAAAGFIGLRRPDGPRAALRENTGSGPRLDAHLLRLRAEPGRPPERDVLDLQLRVERGVVCRPYRLGGARGDPPTTGPSSKPRIGTRSDSFTHSCRRCAIARSGQGPIHLRADQRNAAGDAGGRARCPIPAEIALRLAQHVAVRDRAVAVMVGGRGAGRHGARWRRGCSRSKSMSIRFSPAGFRRGTYGAELALAERPDDRAIEADAGHRIDAVEQSACRRPRSFATASSRGPRSSAARIRCGRHTGRGSDQPRKERRMDVARHPHRQAEFAGQIGERPDPG